MCRVSLRCKPLFQGFILPLQFRLSRNASIINKLTENVIYPTYSELKFDEIEYTALKVIAMFSTRESPSLSKRMPIIKAVDISTDGLKKASIVRDVYSKKLYEHIASTRPELSRSQQLMRLSRLLRLISQVKEISEHSAQLFREAVTSNYEGLSQRLFYDLLIRRY